MFCKTKADPQLYILLTILLTNSYQLLLNNTTVKKPLKGTNLWYKTCTVLYVYMYSIC